MPEWWKETKELTKFPEGLKLDQGEYVIKVTGKPKKVPMPKYGEPEKMVTKLIFPVEYEGKEFAWFVAETFMKDLDGNESDSLFAQLVRLADKNNGLEGATLKVTAKGLGVKKRYFVELK